MRAWAVNKSLDLQNHPLITLRIADRTFLDDQILDGRELDLSLKEHRPKRSLSANGYMWALINQIAAEMRISNDEVYHRLLCDYGTFERVDGQIQYISIRADAKLTGWLYVHTKPIKTVFVGGKEIHSLRSYQGFILLRYKGDVGIGGRSG